MGRGPKKHLKRLNAPRHWMLSKLGGIWAPRPSTGPHKLRECVPLVILLRNRLKYALTRREVLMIVNNRSIKVDGKVRTDSCYPAGIFDVIEIDKTNEKFRLIYDSKGKFVLHRIQEEEAQYKLCRVRHVAKGRKASHGINSFNTGQASAVPYLTTNDARTIRYPDPDIRVHDTIKVDIATGKIVKFVKFDLGKLAMATSGANVGRVGIITGRERHIGGFDIVHLKDKNHNAFATRLTNVFVIGEEESMISLPRIKKGKAGGQ